MQSTDTVHANEPSSTRARPSEWALSRFAPPSGGQRLRELQGVVQPVRAAAAIGRLRQTPRGDGRVLVAYPGLGANDSSLLALRRYLAQRGHDARGWGLGTNRGDPIGILEPCLERLERTVADHGRPANLVGWSLGGLVARELARDRPDLVHRVATFGTPLYGPRYTAAHRAYGDGQLEAIDESIDERYGRPLQRPVLSIHSRNDGVVDHRSCIDDQSPSVKNRAVASTHLSMAFDPDIWVLLAEWFDAATADPAAPATATASSPRTR